jgi:hypothetical protein
MNKMLIGSLNYPYFIMKRLIVESEDYSILRYIKDQICKETSTYGVTVREEEYDLESKRKLIRVDE